MNKTIIYNNAEEIKHAVDDGVHVYWVNKGYTVNKWRDGSYDITWNKGGYGENAIGLTWQDGVTLNGKPNEFFSVNEG